jgi:hypothetical protein
MKLGDDAYASGRGVCHDGDWHCKDDDVTGLNSVKKYVYEHP